MKKNPASQPWFENDSPGLPKSQNEPPAVIMSTLPPPSYDYETKSIKHTHLRDDNIPAAHAVRGLHLMVGQETMKKVGLDTKDMIVRGAKSCGERASPWSAKQRFSPEGEPLVIPINMGYYEEDPYWASAAYKLRLHTA
eukprot:TRINITY_DN1420_c1_g1_i10.p1 TRINITY_DN1420_c1_g1~~TRINITY_DN1420_c1_g1_i10.p1  ORF type:complete len:139 (-),score=25.63 TRINITY_DN1420_c1_g1_i10:316-732(-)